MRRESRLKWHKMKNREAENIAGTPRNVMIKTRTLTNCRKLLCQTAILKGLIIC
jgi:hypothetical protein